MTLTAERLRNLLNYDPETGHFHWLQSRGRVAAGDKAGQAHNAGYISIRVDGKLYLAHRLAWLHITGSWPVGQELDHINGVRSDNRRSNLRDATRAQNRRNSAGHKDSFSGLKGVSFDRRHKRWTASIYVDGKSQFLGNFSCAGCAKEAYDKAAKEAFGEYARL